MDRLRDLFSSFFKEISLQDTLFFIIGLIATVILALMAVELFALLGKYYEKRGKISRQNFLNITRIPTALSLFFLGLYLTFTVAGWDEFFPGGLSWILFPLAISITWGVVRSIDFILIEQLLYEKHGVRLPRLFRDLASWSIYLVVIFLLFKWIFGKQWTDLTALFATSAVISFILGLALQDTLSNLFSGLALHFEGSVRLGEWINVGNWEGEIAGITWRSIKVRTFEGDYVIIPNSTISKSELTNFSQPSRLHIQVLPIGVHYNTPPMKMKRVCLEVLKQVSEVMPSPQPVINLVRYNDFSIDFEIRFWIRDYSQYRRIRDEIYTLLWYYFKREDIVIPFPIRTIHIPKSSQKDKLHLEQQVEELRKVDLFADLEINQLSELADHIRPLVYAIGETIIEQGKPNESFYILKSGLLEVKVRDTFGQERSIGTLEGGDYFGEHSLFTGEPASASIRVLQDVEVASLDKAVFQGLIQSNPQIAQSISHMVSERLTCRDKLLKPSPKEEIDSSLLAASKTNTKDYEKTFFQKMRNLFKF